MLKKILIAAAALLALLLVSALGVITWAKSAAEDRLARRYTVEVPEIPVPWPLTERERLELQGAGGEGELDLDKIALERAIARGEHIVASRGGCTHCHGEDLAGATMVENPALGVWSAPNISGGQGSATASYTVADWTRTIRHGVGKAGQPLTMPSEDLTMLSDREVSDIVAWMRAQPKIDRPSRPSELGPVFALLIGTGEMPIGAEVIDHAAPRPKLPPEEKVSVELGAHLAQGCTGCHRKALEGGPIPGGAPDWPAAANLSPHADGLGTWSEADFFRAMREGRSKDGRALNPAMPWDAYRHMNDTELSALWLYLQSVPAMPTGT